MREGLVVPLECDTSKYGYGYGYQAKITLHERRTRGERTRTASSIFCLGIEAVTGFRGCEAGPNPSAMPCCIFLLQRLTKLKLSGLLLYDNEHRIEAQTGHHRPACQESPPHGPRLRLPMLFEKRVCCG